VANVSTEGQILDVVNDYRQSIYLKDLVARIKSSAASPDDQVRIAVSLVQHIPFDTAKADKNDQGRWFISSSPYGVLYSNRGKCNEKSQLLAFLLKELGYGTAIFEFPGEGHMAVGVKSPDNFAFRSTGYAYVESTSPSIITDTSIQAGSLKIRDFSNPVVIRISDGSAMTTLGEEYADARKMSETPAKIQYTSFSSGPPIYSNPFYGIGQIFGTTYTTQDNPDYVALARKYGIVYGTASGSETTAPADLAGNRARYIALVRANEQISQKDYAGALVSVNSGLSEKPGDRDLLMAKSAIQDLMGDYNGALSTLAAVLSLDPDNAVAYYRKAMVCQDMNNYTAALEAYDTAIRIYPQYVDAMTSRGILFSKQMRYEEALRSYEQALAINPDYANAWAGKGDVLALRGKKDEAIDAYKNALSAEPDLPKVWVALGNLYAGTGKCGEARTCYAKATELDNVTRSPGCTSPLFSTIAGLGCIAGLSLWALAFWRFTKKTR